MASSFGDRVVLPLRDPANVGMTSGGYRTRDFTGSGVSARGHGLSARRLGEIARRTAYVLIKHPRQERGLAVGAMPDHMLLVRIFGVSRCAAHFAQRANDRARTDHRTAVTGFDIGVVVLVAVEYPLRHVAD